MSTKVLHLIKGLGPGGAEQLLVNQARASRGNDVEFQVAFLVSWKNHLVDALTDAGWDVYCLGSDRAWDLRWLVRLRRLLGRSEIDVVHGHSPLVSAFARVVMRSVGKEDRPRSVYTEHNEWGRHRPWTRRLNRWTIGLEDHVFAVSEAVKASMPSDLDIEVLIHGIEVSAVRAQRVHRDAVRSEMGIADDEIVIGTVANFRKEKAYDVLLDAAAEVIAANPKVRFVSVGQGPLEAEIRSQHEHLRLGDRFLILGYRTDATRVMSGFDAFTLSSHHEGLPVSLMDALALGLPVAATAVGGIPEATQNRHALLVTPGDSHVLARAYQSIVEQLASGPAAETETDPLPFDAAASAATLLDLYRRLA